MVQILTDMQEPGKIGVHVAQGSAQGCGELLLPAKSIRA